MTVYVDLDRVFVSRRVVKRHEYQFLGRSVGRKLDLKRGGAQRHRITHVVH